MRAFIVRPFGTKDVVLGGSDDSIDFDHVEEVLILPALKGAGMEGGTTSEIVEQGNIREDMFRLLVTAEIVVADVSIHNANVFYELGIRHGLRENTTFLLRANVDSTRSTCPPIVTSSTTRRIQRPRSGSSPARSRPRSSRTASTALSTRSCQGSGPRTRQCCTSCRGTLRKRSNAPSRGDRVATCGYSPTKRGTSTGQSRVCGRSAGPR